jgi:hypothetical protein
LSFTIPLKDLYASSRIYSFLCKIASSSTNYKEGKMISSPESLERCHEKDSKV